MPRSRRGFDRFTYNIRVAIRALWKGYSTKEQFVDDMLRAMEVGFRDAWLEGAAKVGVGERDLTDEEKFALNDEILENARHLYAFADDIIAGSQAKGGKLTPQIVRGEGWYNRYWTVMNKAEVMAGQNRPLEWVLGSSEHCSSCMKLAGKVKRANYWESRGILPRVPGAPYLYCRGYRCQCSLVPTEKSLSRGPLPRLP